MKVFAGNGFRWRIGRRRTPWRLRTYWVGELLIALADLLNEFIYPFGWIFVPILYVPSLLVFSLVWVLGVALTPFVALVRAMGMAKIVVIAYPLDDENSSGREWKLATDAATAERVLNSLPNELGSFHSLRSLPAPRLQSSSG